MMKNLTVWPVFIVLLSILAGCAQTVQGAVSPTDTPAPIEADDRIAFADLKTSFVEGQHKIRAISFDGTGLIGAATFSHDVPAPPTITVPALAEDAESVGRGAWGVTPPSFFLSGSNKTHP